MTPQRLAPLGGQLIPRPRRPGDTAAGSLVGDDARRLHASPRLNDRDLELLRHLSNGLSTAQISAAMSVTTNTTRTRIRRVRRKLAVSDLPLG
jgi:LuxR family maltose regulon positive regulatory protein